MIQIENLSKTFPARREGWKRRPPVVAVNGLNFRAERGRITGLLGPNGAGKTTTLRILAGLMQADQGVATVDGLDARAQPLAVRARIGVLSDGRGLYPRLSARMNLAYFGRLQSLSETRIAERIEELSALLDLTPLLDRRCAGFSTGESMRIALARAMLHQPDYLILDEPTNGLDVQATRHLRDILRHLKTAEGGSCGIVLATHIMQEVERLCDDVTLIVAGRHRNQGSVAELNQQAGCDNFEDSFVRLAFEQGSAR
ncbi:ATP-binding cassette domain-containing protein [Chromobacterium sp. IIBBL 290-4]|uniref:ABC transporter ATP-binding protein n=1 Tax=Chromobacterium sp. IIBBL 290-4 TaxID=2953890 RepID=UPI0020B77A86|nr:ATP-binding cassette domain-containing protein [Chromobacterium sp. IIBBL 290-4]UTH75099.1 ATP-binding cassette domain-containing protein [Chromobacterium sp. IIBBL 290-4]